VHYLKVKNQKPSKANRNGNRIPKEKQGWEDCGMARFKLNA